MGGFEEVTEDINYRMILGTQGLDKSGKTQFALTAPSPIAIINMDDGLEGVVEKWVKLGKKIWVCQVKVPAIATKDAYLTSWRKSEDAYIKAFQNKDVRTVFVDTATDWWELIRLAEFGSLTPKGDIRQMYGPLNQKFRSMLRLAHGTDKNLIISHKMKKEYITKTVSENNKAVTKDVWEGNYEKVGFKEDGYIVQANLWHRYNTNKGQFETEITNARQDMTLAGYVMGQDECNFATLGTLLFNGTVEEDWQ